MQATGLHAVWRKRPDTIIEVDLGPRSPNGLSKPSGREHDEEKGVLHNVIRRRGLQRGHRRLHLRVRQTRTVHRNTLLLRQKIAGLRRWVVEAVPFCDGTPEDDVESLPKEVADRAMSVPVGTDDVNDVVERHLIDTHVAEPRKHVPVEAAAPVPLSALTVPRVAPVSDDGHRDLTQSRDRRPGPSGERVAARTRDLAVLERGRTSFSQRDKRVRPEADITAPAADDKALHPAARAGRVDDEVEAVAVAITARASLTADEIGETMNGTGRTRYELRHRYPPAAGEAPCPRSALTETTQKGRIRSRWKFQRLISANL